MANGKGHKQVVNHRPNQYSHISIFHADGGVIYETQAVSAVGSDGSRYEDMTNKIVQIGDGGKRAVARLKCTQRGRGGRGDLPPDGKLTITLSGGPTVDPIDVTYVDDVP